MISAHWLNGFEDLSPARSVTKLVADELALPFDDGLDLSAMHLVIFDGDCPAAVCRVLFDEPGNGFIIDRLCVKPESRGLGLGDFLLRLAVRRIYDSGGTRQYALSTKAALGFFAKLGFIPTDENAAALVKLVHEGDVNSS